ncbi:MAG: hypothetical protein ACI9XZ_003057, partial [Alphaproteobacteria bacterium]
MGDEEQVDNGAETTSVEATAALAVDDTPVRGMS